MQPPSYIPFRSSGKSNLGAVVQQKNLERNGWNSRGEKGSFGKRAEFDDENEFAYEQNCADAYIVTRRARSDDTVSVPPHKTRSGSIARVLDNRLPRSRDELMSSALSKRCFHD